MGHKELKNMFGENIISSASAEISPLCFDKNYHVLMIHKCANDYSVLRNFCRKSLMKKE